MAEQPEYVDKVSELTGNAIKARITPMWVWIKETKDGAVWCARYPEFEGAETEGGNYEDVTTLATHLMAHQINNAKNNNLPLPFKPTTDKPPKDAQVRRIAVSV